MHKPAFVLVGMLIGGLLVGVVVPPAEQLRSWALAGLFVQTLIAVGALAEPHAARSQRWALRMVVVHHLAASAPLLLVGLLAGLDTPLGAGSFLLGAVPPAAGLPSYAASCGAHVRPMIRFCLLTYAVGVVLTPVLVLAGFGSGGRLGVLVLTLSVGLVLPAILGTVGRPWLVRVPRTLSFAVVSVGILVVMLGLGSDFRAAIEVGLDTPTFLVLAAAVGVGRCMLGAAVGLALAPPGTRLESIMAGGYKNVVLAAVIAFPAGGPLAMLPALFSLFAEAALLTGLSVAGGRLRGGAEGAPFGTTPGRTSGSGSGTRR